MVNSNCNILCQSAHLPMESIAESIGWPFLTEIGVLTPLNELL